jgi:hypothetical protein
MHLLPLTVVSVKDATLPSRGVYLLQPRPDLLRSATEIYPRSHWRIETNAEPPSLGIVMNHQQEENEGV